MPQLIFYVENGYPGIFNLLTRKTTIGRNEDNDVKLDDPRVSIHHAELVRTGPGAYQLNDLNSDNGTAVNGKLIDERMLKDGDQIKFGSVNAAFVDQSESAEDKLLRETIEKDLKSKADKLAKIEEFVVARTNVLESIPDNKSQLESLEEALAELTQRKENETNHLKALQSELESGQKKRIDLQSELKTQEKDLAELGKDRAELQHQYQKIHAVNENSQKLKEELRVELENLRNEIATERAAFKENIQAHEEAKAVITRAQAIQARIGEFETGMIKLKNSFDQFGVKIAERKKVCENLELEIEERNKALRELNQTLANRKSDVDELSKVIHNNKDRIQSSSEMLETMESTLQKEITELSHSQEAQKSLVKESLSLSHLISGKTAVLHRLTDKFNARSNGSGPVANCPPLRVINPAIRSLVHYFQQGAGVPGQDRVNPIGYYGLAACTKGSMHRDVDTIPVGDEPVLLLLHGEVEKDKALIESVSLQLPGRILLVCWREGQLDSIDSAQVRGLLNSVTGIVSIDARTAEVVDQMQLGRPHLSLPQPSPVDLPEWNVQVPDSNRGRGVFVSVHGFDPNSKLHRGRVDLINQLVAATQTTVTLYQPNALPHPMEGLVVPDHLLTKIATSVKYGECLAFMRGHYFVTGFGSNPDGGYQLSDAELARAVFLGANFHSVFDQLLFPDFCIKGDDIENTLTSATRLLSDSGAYHETVEKSQKLAGELISFETVKNALSDFLGSISSGVSVSSVAS